MNAYIKSKIDNNGWTILLNVDVNGSLLRQYTANNMLRLLNKTNDIRTLNYKTSKYAGEPWFIGHADGWNVIYATGFPTDGQPMVCFDFDATEYIFDIDDLVQVDSPLKITITNIADKRPDLMKLHTTDNWDFILVVKDVELIKFRNPEDRVPDSIELPPPTKEQQEAFKSRIREFEPYSLEFCTTELQNFQFAEANFADCKRHRIFDGNYEPGHIWLAYAAFNHNAAKFAPVLDEAAAAGVKIVKVHAYWADMYGVSVFRPNPQDEEDFKLLIRMCHDRGMKLMVYTSPGWTMITDEYDTAWEFSDVKVSAQKRRQWGNVCHGSPEWRSYFFSNVQKLFDTYDVDGIYVDYGLGSGREETCTKPDHIHPFAKSEEKRAFAIDMLTQLYAICQKNGKKLYLFAESVPGMEKCCDWQCVGESTQTMEAHRLRNVPIEGNLFFLIMTHYYTYYSIREIYASTMPYGHFPILNVDRKTTPGEVPFYYYFFPVWKAMTMPGTHLYREINQTPLLENIPNDCVVSAFVNTDTYVVISNFGKKAAEINFTRPLENLETGEIVGSAEIPINDLGIFRLK